MKFENIRVFNFEGALRGMRNPKNSWHLSDSKFGIGEWDNVYALANDVANDWAEMYPEDYTDIQKIVDKTEELFECGRIYTEGDICEYAYIGPKDMRLAKALINGGSEHRKFLRQIIVTVDITAPLYW
jgi:hypothetical protein